MKSVAIVLGAAVSAVSAVSAGVAAAQCGDTYTTDLLAGFRAIGNPQSGDVQNTGDAWTFRRQTESGTLLTGTVLPPALPAGYWASLDQPFTVPLLGPVLSPNPAENQGYFQDRPASFTGLYMHPGFSAMDVFVVFSPGSPVTIQSASVRMEVIGDLSDGVSFRLLVRRGGVVSTLIGPTSVFYTVTGSTLVAATGLPLTLNPGDAVWLRIDGRTGVLTEDWVNANVTLTMSGGPVVLRQPRISNACLGDVAEISVAAAGSGTLSYRWMRGGVPMVDGPGDTGSVISGATTATLHIAGVSALDAGEYACEVTDSCGTALSRGAALAVCPGDFNCDGGVDGADVSAFFAVWEAGDPAADLTVDGGVDGADVELFFARWSGGC